MMPFGEKWFGLSERDKASLETTYCYGVEDAMDGYCIHAIDCRSFGRFWSGPNSDCIKKPDHDRGW